MPQTQPTMTGGCQCGAVRYALYEPPESSVCHCRMCQKAVGAPVAWWSKVSVERFAWTRGDPASFRSSSIAERHFCSACGTPLTFHYLQADAIDVSTGSLDNPASVPITKNFCAESRLPWLHLLVPGAVPDVPSPVDRMTSFQHPDHDEPAP